MLINLIGYSATVIGSLLFLPQVIKSYRTKKVSDVSLLFLLMYFFNCILWGIYGLLIHSSPVFVANLIGLLLGAVQLVFKLKFRD